ncbi:unnamed protein product [Blepharisma stoltei]|uniref:Kinetochore protein SPC25 n=1 Tax=Blepharisma stoltei TaxID=1481888 RepID=A0AAU9JSC9_9CILI|nr:unnamed protein product [Blepharisma stoltei]
MEIQTGEVEVKSEYVEKIKEPSSSNYWKTENQSKFSSVPPSISKDTYSIEEVDVSPDLKRRSPIVDSRPLKFRKREDKRVSFGENTEILISPRPPQSDLPEPLPEDQDIDSLLLFYTNENHFEQFTSDLSKALDNRIESTKSNIISALDHLKDMIAYHKKIPTQQEIDNINQENDSLHNELQRLEMELAAANQNIEIETKKAENEENEIERNLEEIKAEYDKKIENLTEDNQHYKKIHNFYSNLMNLKADRKGGIFRCVAGYKSSEISFEIDMTGRFIRYTPLECKSQVGNLLKYEITDLRQTELSMLFTRILKHCITTAP